MFKHLKRLANFSALFAILALALAPAASQAQAPMLGASIAQINRTPSCVPNILPFTGYPRVVSTTDSIGQHGDTGGPAQATVAGAITGSFNLTAGSNVAQYTGTDVSALNLYYNQGIAGTGLTAGTLNVGQIDTTHIRLSQPATANETGVTLTAAQQQGGPQSWWTIVKQNLGEYQSAQAFAPFFRYDSWNDASRAWGASGNAPPLFRGSNMGYSGGNTLDISSRVSEVKPLAPQILIISIGVNNLSSATFRTDLENLVDTYHVSCPSMPILLTNIRATATADALSRPVGAIIYDNAIIADIVAKRSAWQLNGYPLIKLIDLFTPSANNPSSYGSTAFTVNTTAGSPTITLSSGFPWSVNAQTPSTCTVTVTGTGIPANSTIQSFNSNSITLSNNATATGIVSVTETPAACAHQTGTNQGYYSDDPTNTAIDYLHPGPFMAQFLDGPNIIAGICSYILNNCAASTAHNVFLDMAGASLLTSSPAANLSGTPQSISHAYTNSTYMGTTPTGIDLVGNNAYYSSVVATTSSNTETGGNMMQLVVMPGGSLVKETITIKTLAAISSTLGAGNFIRMWAEFEIDKNLGWAVLNSNLIERKSSYSNNYYDNASVGIHGDGTSGTRRVWVSTECFAFPQDSTGVQPTFGITFNPQLATGSPTITMRRWNIQQCIPGQHTYKVGANDNHKLKAAA